MDLNKLLTSDFEDFKKAFKKNNANKEQNYNLLKTAILIKNTDAIDLLLKKIDINFKKDGDSALFTSILNKDSQTTKYLIGKGAFISDLVFSHCDDLELAKDLLQIGKIDKKNTFFMDFATLLNNKEKVDFLLKEKFSFDDTSIDNAIKNNNKEIFENLINSTTDGVSPTSFLKLDVAKHKMLIDLLFHEDKIDAKKMLKHSILKGDKEMINYLTGEKKVEVKKDFIDMLDDFDLKEFLLSLVSSNKEQDSLLPPKLKKNK